MGLSGHPRAGLARQAAWVLCFVYLSPSHGLRMGDRAGAPEVAPATVPVTVRNRMGLGAPLAIERPGDEGAVVVEDGGSVHLQLRDGEVLHMSTEVEALVHPYGDEDPYGDVDPYGDGEGEYKLLELKAAYRQRGPRGMTVTASVEDMPPKPVRLVAAAVPTSRLRDADKHLKAAITGAAAAPGKKGGGGGLSGGGFSAHGVFEAPLGLPLLEPLAHLAKAADSGHPDARALSVLIQLTSWAEDAAARARD